MPLFRLHSNKVRQRHGITSKTYAGKIPGVKFNESELRADFPNGARITILGGENDQALRGIFLDGCVFDETQSINPSVFPEVIRPALADRKGWCIFIGTPKGRNYFMIYIAKPKKRRVGMPQHIKQVRQAY